MKRCFSGVFRQFPAKAKIILLDFLRLHSRSQLLRKIGKKSVSTKKPFSNRKKYQPKMNKKALFGVLGHFSTETLRNFDTLFRFDLKLQELIRLDVRVTVNLRFKKPFLGA